MGTMNWVTTQYIIAKMPQHTSYVMHNTCNLAHTKTTPYKLNTTHRISCALVSVLIQACTRRMTSMNGCLVVWVCIQCMPLMCKNIAWRLYGCNIFQCINKLLHTYQNNCIHVRTHASQCTTVRLHWHGCTFSMCIAKHVLCGQI